VEANELAGQTTDLKAFLEGLGLATDDSKVPVKAFETTPAEVAVIKTAATKVSQFWSKAIAGAGGLTAVATAVAGVVTKPANDLVITLVASVAFVLAAAVLAVAHVVADDLRARGSAAAAQYQAEGRVVAAFLSSYGSGTATAAAAPAGQPSNLLAGDLSLSLLVAAASGARPLTVRQKNSGARRHVTGLRYEEGSLQVRVSTGSTHKAADPWLGLTEFDELGLND
jgi:hypothetical protein